MRPRPITKRGTMIQNTAIFQSRLVEPFAPLLGEPLRDVEYWVLEMDADDFRAEQPNLFGVQIVRLRFGAVSLAVTWGGEKSLRSEGIYHHIQALEAATEDVLGPAWAENLRCIPALSTAHWREVISEPLSGVEVIGFSDSPQAIRLLFPHTSLVVAVGYSGDDLLVGDGDDVFVFSAQEWQEQIRRGDHAWTRLWLSAATNRAEVLVGSAK